MPDLRHVAVAGLLATGSFALAACETTPAPIAQIEGVQPYQLSAAEYELVRLAVYNELAEPDAAYFHPNPAATRGGAIVAVCGLLNGTNMNYYTTDAVYVVMIDYRSGAPRVEIIGIGGSGRAGDRQMREFCRTELGINI